MQRCCVLWTICLLVVVFSGGMVQAAGVVTFRIEVLSGLTIASPDDLAFQAVAPKQTTRQDLNLKVWSNVEWELSVEARDEESGGLCGILEVEDEDGLWHDLFARFRVVRSAQPITGPNGQDVIIPFRFTGSYEDEPGDYAVQVEFTVVPSL